MGVLQRFERRLENLVEGTFAKVFKSEVQPVEIAQALQREVDDKRAIVSAGRVLAPNDFVVELSKEDHSRLVTYAEPLGKELAAMVREHAEESGYSLLGDVEVHFERNDGLDTGVFRVNSGVRAGPQAAETFVRYAGEGASARAAATVPPDSLPGAPRLTFGGVELRDRESPAARGLDDGFFLRSPVTVIGRGEEVELQLADPLCSRRHAEIRYDGENLILTDLNSTNGTTVNNLPVHAHVLKSGDRIGIGETTLVYERDELSD